MNGSEESFQRTKRPFEENSVLNDEDGKWIKSHGVNRYRDWDELRYSLRSVERYASDFRNKIQIVVNSVDGTEAGKQVPSWLNNERATREVVQVIAQEEFFDREKHACLPTFNSLTIENQLFNTPSDTDYVRITYPLLARVVNSLLTTCSYTPCPTTCFWASNMLRPTYTRRSSALLWASKPTPTAQHSRRVRSMRNASARSHI